MQFTERFFRCIQQFPAEPPRKAEQAVDGYERAQCDHCRGGLPPGQHWRQGTSHHQIFSEHLLCKGCQGRDQRLEF